MGRIRGAVWVNEGRDGTWYATSFSRIYRDGEGNWKAAASFGKDDLLVVAEVARACFLAIMAMTPARADEFELKPPKDLA